VWDIVMSWGTDDINIASDTRQRYPSALRAANSHHDFTDLIAFGQS
jgi:hypothetical protein